MCQAKWRDKRNMGETIPNEVEFTDPGVVASLFHPQKQLVLEELIKAERTIYDLKRMLNLNPGIIKRHIDDLLAKNLIVQTRTGTNEMGMNLKYYRAVAKKFKIRLEWPTED
jgi:predicted ArsR family transcriptional regulator